MADCAPNDGQVPTRCAVLAQFGQKPFDMLAALEASGSAHEFCLTPHASALIQARGRATLGANMGSFGGRAARWAAACTALAVLGCGVGDVERGAERAYSEVELKASLRAALLAQRMKEAAADAAYAFAPAGEGAFAVSAQGGALRAAFRAGAAELEAAAQWRAGLALTRAGCEGALDAVASGTAVLGEAAPNRLTYERRAGALHFEERWLSGEPGLEQSFVFETAACGPRALVIELAATGLTPSGAGGETSTLQLRDSSGIARLRYGDLYAHDAAGAPLPVAMRATGDRIVIRVDAALAEWPIVVDPLIVAEPTKLSRQLGAARDEFGGSIAIDGNTALVAAPFSGFTRRGVVYVFVREDTSWTLQAVLAPSDRPSDDQSDGFGWSLAVSGNTALIGSPEHSRGAGLNQGAARVFVRSGEVWTERQTLTAPDAAAYDRFGSAVALDGDVALVGAPGDDVGSGEPRGSAYVFVNGGAEWRFRQNLSSSDSSAYDEFGAAVALGPDHLVVGAPSAGPDLMSKGQAYLFTRNESTWREEQILLEPSGAGVRFGQSVAIEGERALVGDPHLGAAYLFSRGDGGWSPEQSLRPNNGHAHSFGASVTLANGRALVGAPGTRVGASERQGAAYLFVHTETGWIERAEIAASDGASHDGFGSAVASSGDTLLVGAPYATIGSNEIQGAAYVFRQAADETWPQERKLTATDSDGRETFGVSIALDGDRALVGASGMNEGQGAAYVFARTPTGWSSQQKLTAHDGLPADHFGSAVALSGRRALIGAAYADLQLGSFDNAGAAYVFLESEAGWIEEQKLAREGARSFGAAVALSGDHALVGAPGVQPGSAHVFLRDALGWHEEQELLPGASSPNTQFGHAVALDAGTALVGAPFDAERGAAYVFVRRGAEWVAEQKLSVGAEGDTFGWSVALRGDDALVGAPGRYTSSPGSAHVFSRSGGNWTREQVLTASDGSSFDFFGDSVALSSDAALIGAPAVDLDDGRTLQAGAAYVFVRSGASWFQQEPRLVAADAKADEKFGHALALSPTTALVAAPYQFLGSRTSQGSVYVLEVAGLAGSSCQLDDDCARSYSCVDGVCCTSRCEAACEVCSSARGAVRDGTCTPKARGESGDTACPGNVSCDGASGSCPGVCEADDQCPGGTYCALGDCVEKKAQGQPCEGSNECATAGGCADSFCCDQACTGSCETCSAEHGAGENGVCSARQASEGAPPCPGDVLCDGMSRDCPLECSDDAHCASVHHCELVTATCQPKRQDGARCVANSECRNGHCEDGVCCESACNGQCESCAEPDAPGQCVAVEGEPRPGRTACLGAGSACGGRCDGAKRDGCVFPSSGTECDDPATCENDSMRAASTCDGAGRCRRGSLSPCGAYACSPETNECLTSCTTNADCRLGAVCNSSDGTGACSDQGTRCDGGYDVVAVDGTVSSCRGYRCVAGACQQQCGDDVDCAPSHTCIETACLATRASGPGAPSDQKDRGCVLSPAGGRGGPIFAASLLAYLLVRRRQRPAQRVSAWP